MTDVTLDTLRKLHEPLDPEVIHWRVGATNSDKTKGLALAYVDARDVMERLDRVVGPSNWQVRHPWSDGSKMSCEIGIRVGDEWIWKGDGAGATDVEADKGTFSDAFKRAGVMWGIARYLYDLDSPWVALEAKGRSYIIKPSELPRLQRLVGGETNRKAKDDDWHPGPCKTRQDIHAMTGKAIDDLKACSDLDMLAGFERSYRDFLEQLAHNAPKWWDNDQDPIGMKQRIEEMRNHLTSRDADRQSFAA